MKHQFALAATAAIFGLIVGYGLGGTRLQAQLEPSPFRVGDTIEVGQQCRIAETFGLWARCHNPTAVDRQMATETWINTAAVEVVTRHR